MFSNSLVGKHKLTQEFCELGAMVSATVERWVGKGGRKPIILRIGIRQWETPAFQYCKKFGI